MEICISLGQGPLLPLLSIIIKPNYIVIGITLGLGLGLVQCKHTIIPKGLNLTRDSKECIITSE